MPLDQIGIALLGVTAIWLSQDARLSWRRWSSIFGMLAQPFWFWAAWKAGQWGIFGLSFLYTYAWARGIWTVWLRDSIGHRREIARATRRADRDRALGQLEPEVLAEQ